MLAFTNPSKLIQIGDNVDSILPSVNLHVHDIQTIRSIKQWLSSCTCVLSGKSDSPFRPTRIIDLGDQSDGDSFVVKKSEEMSHPAYLCLSYCWGGQQTVYCSIRDIN